jgi:uncharacterized membrane protein YoaK (UPF0700 family)
VSARESGRQRITAVSVELGALLAMVGGFLDAYSFIDLGGVFSNTQTGNIVLLGVEAARGHWVRSARHMPSILAFVAGVAVAEMLRRPRVAAVVRRPARAALVMEILVLTAVGFLPAAVPDSVKVVVIAFVASVQVSTFRTLITWSYNTTIMTGNLRSASQALYLAIADRDPERARKARNFALIILSFMIGALIGGWLGLRFGSRAIWAAAGLILVALSLFLFGEREDT